MFYKELKTPKEVADAGIDILIAKIKNHKSATEIRRGVGKYDTRRY